MDFEKLALWSRSVELSVSIYQHFAESKDFSFKDQITRSSLSIPSNIAEGMERGTDKDKARFLWIAKGSSAELRTQAIIAQRIGYVSDAIASQWVNESENISRMLMGLIKSCNQSKQ